MDLICWYRPHAATGVLVSRDAPAETINPDLNEDIDLSSDFGLSDDEDDPGQCGR